MEYKRYDSRIVLRLEPGDEICGSIISLAEKESIKLGSVCGIGGADALRLGIFNCDAKRYNEFEYTGTHEITSLIGNITEVNGKPYLHLHVTAAGGDMKVVAGHLLYARISLTAEISIDIIDGNITRKRNEDLGINEMLFLD